MPFVYHNVVGGRPQINAAKTFVDAFNGLNHGTTKFPSFDSVLDSCETLVRSENEPTNGALGNTRGAWYQWLLALAWKKYASTTQLKKRLIKLPSKNSGKWHRLYESQITDLIDDLENKLSSLRITLETSNPDFALLQEDEFIPVSFSNQISLETLQLIDTEYQSFFGAVEYGNMSAFLSIKTSLRPDRRLQTQFEATMIKALQAYIATRKWDTQKASMFVVIVNEKPSNNDIESLSAIAAHSLVTPLVLPQKSVDKLTLVNDYKSASELFSLLT